MVNIINTQKLHLPKKKKKAQKKLSLKTADRNMEIYSILHIMT